MFNSIELAYRLQQVNICERLSSRKWPFSIHSKHISSLSSAITLREKGLLSNIEYDVSVFRSKINNPNLENLISREERSTFTEIVRNTGAYYYVFGRQIEFEIERFDFNCIDLFCHVRATMSHITHAFRRVQDICGVLDHHILYVANGRQHSVIGVIPVGLNTDVSPRHWPLREKAHCCDYDPFSELIVVGTRFNLIKIHDIDRLFRIKSVSGDIHSVALQRNGLGVLYAEANGNIYERDFRSNDTNHIIKMKSCITRMKILGNGYEVIMSGHENQLCMIDMRMNIVSRDFQEHVNHNTTIPFSYCEGSKLLCSAGEDNEVRIWNINNSCPVTVFPKPNEVPIPPRRYAFLIPESPSMYLHNFYKSEITTFNLMPGNTRDFM